MKRFLLLFLAVVISLGIAVEAQTKIDVVNPVGTYTITDYLGKKMTLKVSKGGPAGILTIGGDATLTVGGRTYKGKWSYFEGNRYFAFESYGGTRFSYNLPSGPAKTDQIIIYDDGRASYNASELMKSDGDWIKVRKNSASRKKSSKR